MARVYRGLSRVRVARDDNAAIRRVKSVSIAFHAMARRKRSVRLAAGARGQNHQTGRRNWLTLNLRLPLARQALRLSNLSGSHPPCNIVPRIGV